jgi:uncharacterized FAD-dependent dehydrogenase
MVDTFGSTSDSLSSDMVVRGRPGIGFKLTDDGDFDLKNKRLSNIAIPIESDDAVSKTYHDHDLASVIKTTKENIKIEKESIKGELSDLTSQLNQSIETVSTKLLEVKNEADNVSEKLIKNIKLLKKLLQISTETVIFQHKGKLDKINMFWGLGQVGKFSDGSCFILPYRGVVVKIILYSTDVENDVVISLVKGNIEFGVYLTKTKNELYKVYEPNNLIIELGDKLRVKSIEKTGTKRELYQAQVMLRYLI